MTFFDKIKAHIGGLVLIKNDLYWYNSCAWDKNPDRICLVLDVVNYGPADDLHGIAVAQTQTSADGNVVLAQLLIDGEPFWVWLTDEYVQLILGGDQ